MRKRVAVLILGVQLAVVPACAGDDAARPTSSRPKTIDCGPGYLGPWTLCPEAAWTRRIVEEAGYNIIGNTGSALLAAGRGYEYSIWTTPLDRPPRELAEKEGWKLLA